MSPAPASAEEQVDGITIPDPSPNQPKDESFIAPIPYKKETLKEFKKLPNKSADLTLQNMSFNEYWEFRNFEIKKILTKIDPVIQNPDKKTLKKIFKGSPIASYGYEEQQQHLKKIKNLYTSVNITNVKINNNIIIKINQNNTELATVTQNPQRKNLSFKLNANLTAEQKETAICIIMDQAIRHQARSKNKSLEIFGYKNDPATALRMFQLAIIQGAQPTINPTTLATWKTQAGYNEETQRYPNLPNKQQDQFIHAIEFYEKFKILAKKKKKNLVKQLKTTKIPSSPQTSSESLPPNTPETTATQTTPPTATEKSKKMGL